MRRLWFILVLLLSPAASHAALYEFTLEGTVTFAIYGPAVGDRCILRYVADNSSYVDTILGGKGDDTGNIDEEDDWDGLEVVNY